MSCHELGYARYETTAADLEIPHDLVLTNLVFDDSLIGDLILNSMSTDDAENWFGAAPPDLTLAGRVHSPDWIYTYLRSFYNDSSRPLGTNNTIYENVGMPNVLYELQGDVSRNVMMEENIVNFIRPAMDCCQRLNSTLPSLI